MRCYPAFLALIAIASLPLAARANLLVNGSFEAGTYTFGSDGAVDLGVGSTAITGWTVVTNNVAPAGAGNIYGLTAEDGNVSLDLQSYSDGFPYGGVQQSVATIIGHSYELSFYVGVQNTTSNSVGPASVSASAKAGNGSATTSNSFTNSLTGAGEQWKQFALDFTAADTTTIITISGLSTQGGAYIGLDNVSLVETAAPEPASLALLSLAAPVLLKRRRRV